MNCLEKRHASHKASMQHLGHLDSFMDETDREVMSLTDRAFKSLCIGDEAIYNDSEFTPSPVSCHKPLAEEVAKKTHENSSMSAKKHSAHPLNGVNESPWKINKGSSLFAAFMAKKNGETTKMTNGDSWDKSALLSIQRELSEFSSGFQNHLADRHASQDKNNIKSLEKSNKSSKDTSAQSGKPAKGKHSKSSKLRKLNSKNFFLHSEFSPFQSWRDLNKFPFGLDNMEIFQSNGPPEWYDSPLYKKLTMSHRSHVPESEREEKSRNISLQALQDKPEPEVLQQAAQTLTTVPLKAETSTKTQPQVLLKPSGPEQRCQSEGDHSAPWRKNRNRAKSAVPLVQPLMSSFAEQTKTVDEDVQPNKKEVRTMEDQASSSSTPFSILQLLTPVIPSRQGTGSSEVLQAVHSTLDLPPLPEKEIRPSPEIKREGYKSMASSLLFNLKDNRKRVKTMYSPPKFKGLDSADQNKLSPLTEQDNIKDAEGVPELPDARITSPGHQKVDALPACLRPESADQQNSQSGGLPDDFLALSLLQAGNKGSPFRPSKSNKAMYPSLNLYRKASPDHKAMGEVDSHPAANKNTKQSQNADHTPVKDGKELQRKPTDDTSESTHGKAKRTSGEVRTENTIKEKYPLAVLRKLRSEALALTGSKNQDKQNTGDMRKIEPKLVNDQECLNVEAKPKHLFSARQNNYIKSQRYVSVDEEEEGDYGGDGVASAVVKDAVPVRDLGSSNAREGRKSKKDVGVHNKAKEVVDVKPDAKNNDFGIKDYTNVLAAYRGAKNDPHSMKGNTSVKRALFAKKEQVLRKTPVPLKKEGVVMDKYELAKAALEEVIAEREQRKKQTSTDRDDVTGRRDLREDYEQVNLSAWSQRDTLESATEDRRGGHKGIADFKPRSQIVHSMPERDTKHGESHVAEVNLAGPCKQEGAAEHRQHAAGQINYTERDRSGRHRRQSEADNVKPLDKITQHKEPKNISLVNENESSGDSNSTSNLQKIRPEVPPRRGRASSQSEDGLEADKSGQDEESVSKEVKNVKATVSKDRGPVRGHVSALKERFDKEKGVQGMNVQGGLGQAEGDPTRSQVKQEVSNVSESASAFEPAPARHHLEGTGADPSLESDKNSRLPEGKEEERKCESVEDIEHDLTREKEDVSEKESECASEVLQEPDVHQNQSNDCRGNSVEELSTGPFEKLDAEKIKSESDPQEIHENVAETSETGNPVSNSVTVYDILKQSESPVGLEQSDQGDGLSKETEEFLLDGPASPASKCDENLEQMSERVVSPPSDVENKGWVRCLIESAKILSPACQSGASSPTMGKPALFKVKDNTFSASPVTKTVRPVLHKTLSEICQPWSPRGSLSGSEKGEDPLKDLQSPTVLSPTPPSTPARSPQPNSLSQLLLPAAPTGRKEMDSLAVPDEDEMHSAVSSVSEGIESCGTSTGDTMEETTSFTTPADGTEGSKAPSERSESVCSGTDTQSQSKPPAVPPKTEKALRRAMKLTTRRIQKAESKSKAERKGRSSEKSAHHKPERRHHSTDSSPRAPSIDQSSGDDKPLPKTHQSERHARQDGHGKEKDVSRKHGSNRIRNQDARNGISEEQTEDKGQLHVQRSADSERLGRTSVKYLPDKLDRRAQSLDRYLSDKPELSKMNNEPSMNLHTSKRSPMHQNSIEHVYASTAPSIVTQSFPMTQRKLLQDPDSGQYFVVDMPVQVKTKTFFDPETGSYVQLPVQSPKGSVPKAPSMEVVNAPSLVLYHGFVPMPVSSIPAQKSAFSLGAVVSPNDFEPSEMERHEDVYQKQRNAGGRPYLEPVSHKHLAEDEIDGVR